jgi:hypothetical protein
MLADALGLEGRILWTELAKCESATGKTVPLQTLRTCSATFLQRELKAVPEKWPLLAAGRETYKALAYQFPSRTILGVPHPTGSRGDFDALFENGLLLEAAKTKGVRTLASHGASFWLTALG